MSKMTEISEVLDRVKDDIRQIEQCIRNDIKQQSDQMDDLLHEILLYGLEGGGKRFRPMLCVISGRMCSGRTDNDLITLATAFEYIHLATLFHDDVIDQAETRRGKASVVEKYGLNGAILAGDYLHARSMDVIGCLGGKEALHIFCNATRGMVDGEFVQLRNAKNFNQSEDDYYRAIKGKTGLLISAATEIGALFGGANIGKRKALKEYGKNLGYAFQIADDLLDYLGDQEKTGKRVGNDLAEGKMTLPLIYSMSSAERKDIDWLLHVLRNEKMREESFNDVRSFIERYDGFSKTREQAERCCQQAISALDIFLPDHQGDVSILKGLAKYSILREK